MAEVTKEEFKKVMGSFAAGVTIVTTVDDSGARLGLTATAFTSLSMEPPLCLVCIDKRGASHDAVVVNRRFAVNFLSADQTELSNRFASRRDDKFDGIDVAAGSETGCPLLGGALATLECELVDVFPGGDHSIFVGKLVSVSAADLSPLLYFRGGYRGLAD